MTNAEFFKNMDDFGRAYDTYRRLNPTDNVDKITWAYRTASRALRFNISPGHGIYVSVRGKQMAIAKNFFSKSTSDGGYPVYDYLVVYYPGLKTASFEPADLVEPAIIPLDIFNLTFDEIVRQVENGTLSDGKIDVLEAAVRNFRKKKDLVDNHEH